MNSYPEHSRGPRRPGFKSSQTTFELHGPGEHGWEVGASLLRPRLCYLLLTMCLLCSPYLHLSFLTCKMGYVRFM